MSTNERNNGNNESYR